MQLIQPFEPLSNDNPPRLEEGHAATRRFVFIMGFGTAAGISRI
ncbi:MAG: hypothetical protein PHO08_06710 [Methylococcales bacterium]|nr:hypothetical protein [Methylococcales bacterium]